MSRILFLILVAIALPTPTNAETNWLVIKTYSGGLQTIKMQSLEQCEKQGKKFVKATSIGGGRGYACLIGQ